MVLTRSPALSISALNVLAMGIELCVIQRFIVVDRFSHETYNHIFCQVGR